jgi:hypothetical protein
MNQTLDMARSTQSKTPTPLATSFGLPPLSNPASRLAPCAIVSGSPIVVESWRFEIPFSSVDFLQLFASNILPSPSVFSISNRSERSSSARIWKTRKCQACGMKFTPDHRSRERQAFCAKAACQQKRRTLRQRLRRINASLTHSPALKLKEEQTDSRRSQEASVLSEGDFRSEHPVIIVIR